MNTPDLITIPNALPQTMLNAVAASWPNESWQYWHRYTGKTADKYGSMDRCRLPYAITAAIDHLAAVCGSYMPDDCFVDYDLHAAGMHMIPPGGFLGRHLDAVCHPIRHWRRRWSIVCNVNRQWSDWQGGFLLIDGYDPILPQPGTAIMFATPNAWHEVSPVSRDSMESRKTLALFGWSLEPCHGNIQATFA